MDMVVLPCQQSEINQCNKAWGNSGSQRGAGHLTGCTLGGKDPDLQKLQCCQDLPQGQERDIGARWFRLNSVVSKDKDSDKAMLLQGFDNSPRL